MNNDKNVKATHSFRLSRSLNDHVEQGDTLDGASGNDMEAGDRSRSIRTHS